MAWSALPAVACAAEATLKGPASAAAGSTVSVAWTGPGDGYDRIYIVPAGSPDGEIVDYNATYASAGSPLKVSVPEESGPHEIRYFDSSGGGSILARRPILVTPVSATLQAPATAVPGSVISVSWTGPGNYDDHITVVPVGAPEYENPQERTWIHESPSDVSIPGEPGRYEIRYLTGQKNSTLARAPITVLDTSATLKGPAQAEAGSSIEVAWTGPGNSYDQVVVSRKGDPDETWEHSNYVTAGSPLELQAPLSPGAYELRYIMAARASAVLGRADIRITPAKQEPGLIRVTASSQASAAGGAVEIILDTSGSMLQRLGSKRRIDIAKGTLTQLTGGVIPPGTPFALRVFGRGTDSCQTDLDIPLQPLDARAASTRIAALKAKNNAKTPIGASLANVASDLGSARGERLVVLVTDGEETCDGDPAREIAALRKGGIDVRVNIVGFALEDARLAATFKTWSSIGDGAYFDARDAAGLTRALTRALAPLYDVVDAKDKVVASGSVGGDAVRVMPGDYTVRRRGSAALRAPVSVRAKETSTVGL